MKRVRIAELTARLDEYLRVVRSGDTIGVLDDGTLIARIVPARKPLTLRIRKPALGAPPPNRVPLPGPAALTIDVVDLLLDERQELR